MTDQIATVSTETTAATIGSVAKVADIEKQLTQLWAQVSGDNSAVLRATTLNLIILAGSEQEALSASAGVSDRHPSRQIVVVVSPDDKTPLTATPSIFCRPAFGREMRSQVCGERIVVEVGRDGIDKLSGAIQSLLVADQPVYLLMLGEVDLINPILKGLNGALTGLIVDSGMFKNQLEGMRAVLSLRESPHFNCRVYDLNWMRLVPWCLALAGQFDSPEDLAALQTLQSVEVTHKGSRGAALLYVGWLADRLGWRTTPGRQENSWRAVTDAGQVGVSLKLSSSGDNCLHTVTLKTKKRTYSVEYAEADRRLVVKRDSQSAVRTAHHSRIGELVSAVLDAAGSDDLYEHALRIAVVMAAESSSLKERVGLIVVSDPAALNRLAAREFVSAARQAVRHRKQFTVALSGGSTPKTLYELLAQPPYRDQIPWESAHIFWGDERLVPVTDPDSNQRMAREALLDRVPIPPENIHAIAAGTLKPEEAAARYAKDIRAFFGLKGKALPEFDLILLGLGDDGHTASLFPHTAGLKAKGEQLFIANDVPQMHTTRLTLTLGVINSAANVMFLVSGAKKADILYEVMRGPRAPEDHPAQLIAPTDGLLTIIADRAAAVRLIRK